MGGPATQLAYYISHCLMPLVDVVMDIHTGGGRCGTSQHGLSSKNMTLITSDCGATRYLSIKWP